MEVTHRIFEDGLHVADEDHEGDGINQVGSINKNNEVILCCIYQIKVGL